jgi:hypothetical protein
MKTPAKPTTLAALLTAFLLTGCATDTLVTDSACRSFKPISNSKRDTEQTRREVVAHNKVFDTICTENKPQQVASVR